jgi:predicted GNAT family acetyltransferase
MTAIDIDVRDNADERRYEARVAGDVAGFIRYIAQPTGVMLVHTDIDPAYEGQGLGSRLVAGALDDIRSRGLRVVPQCPFVRSYIERHPQYADLVDG